MSITLVTCYYKLDKSKHTQKEYNKWIHNFLLNICSSNVVVYTSQENFDYIKSICDKNNFPKFNYKIYIKELQDFEIVKRYPNIWEKQWEMDPNKRCGRGIGCYILWNAKFDLLNEVMKENPYESDKFVWNDIGNVRNEKMLPYLASYPQYDKVSENHIDIVLLSPFSNEKQMYFQNEVHFSGSIFGGGKDILVKLHKLYYLYLEMYLRANKFIGCDQQIISTLYLRNKNLFNCVTASGEIDPWFHMYCHYGYNTNSVNNIEGL